MTSPASTWPQFRILPATEKDCPGLATVEVLSFNDVKNEPLENAIVRIMLGPPTEQCIEFRTKSFIDRFQTHPATRFWKAVVDDVNEQNCEKIVACGLWKFFLKPEKIPDWKDITEWPLDVSPNACNEFTGAITEMRRKHMDETCYGFLEILGTLPEYRGYGIASALMKVGLDQAKKEGLNQFWIYASIDAEGLYRKYGFKEIDAVRRDITKYGGVGNSNIIGMWMAFDS
ncbi:hypothetical protein N7478_011865 [Penicillium angulare]|uniref:uncharacterized protein n=1 Tax=Penicillium angulare TaxID=116970 RepID=UPI00254087C4|nr:uncharacterized protein N7478_011865 [Penicillium angulare]KAJ5261270.1 hypothetical protein N7478_011865 [Penicillium angulare]